MIRGYSSWILVKPRATGTIGCTLAQSYIIVSMSDSWGNEEPRETMDSAPSRHPVPAASTVVRLNTSSHPVLTHGTVRSSICLDNFLRSSPMIFLGLGSGFTNSKSGNRADWNGPTHSGQERSRARC